MRKPNGPRKVRWGGPSAHGGTDSASKIEGAELGPFGALQVGDARVGRLLLLRVGAEDAAYGLEDV